MSHYSGNISNALLQIFPNIGLDISRFGKSHSTFLAPLLPIFNHLFVEFWQHPMNRRKFFEKYAKANKFDPLVAENWYSAHLRIGNAKV